nr:histone H1-delta-like [Penaeus vannamei]
MSFYTRRCSKEGAILRVIVASFQLGVERAAGVHLKQALRRGVAAESLQQTKGVGASGSFKLSKEELKKAVPIRDSAEKKVTKNEEKIPRRATEIAKKSTSNVRIVKILRFPTQ